MKTLLGLGKGCFGVSRIELSVAKVTLKLLKYLLKGYGLIDIFYHSLQVVGYEVYLQMTVALCPITFSTLD